MGISMQVARGSVSLGRRCAARRLVVRASVAEAPIAAETAAPQVPAMDDVINVCKRRGFIFQSSDVYGGFAGFFDYGPLGVELRQNIKQAWWKDMVHRRDDIVGLDSSIISSPEVWKASGHVAGFSDPMVDCKESKLRYRADQLFWGRAEVDGETIGYVSVLESGTMEAEALATAEKMKRKMGRQGTLALSELRDYTEVCAAEALANSAWPLTSDAPLTASGAGEPGGAAAHPIPGDRAARLAYAAARVQPHVPDECGRDVGCDLGGIPPPGDRAGARAAPATWHRPEPMQSHPSWRPASLTARRGARRRASSPTSATWSTPPASRCPLGSRRSARRSAMRSHRATSSSAPASLSRFGAAEPVGE